MELRRRKKNRLDGHDYVRSGCYFITVCTNGREHFFWGPAAPSWVGADIIRPPAPVLSQYGRIAEWAIQNISQHYSHATVDKYVIMPNHVHMIISLTNQSGRMISAPTKAIPTIVGQMKRIVSQKAGFPIWQKSYHDHIIRGDAGYRRIWEYIDTNPAKWLEDCYYEDGVTKMSKQKEEKTNVMRILDQKKIPYTPHAYPVGDAAPDGVTVARLLGQDPAAVFKTLVAKGASGGYYVFDIPVAATLDLKKAARAAGEKSVAMLPARELLPLTGYVHGGCSPVGMKKRFPTLFHESCLNHETICVSAGKVGFQVELKPAELMALTGGSAADLIVEG